MDPENHDGLIANFTEVTGADAPRARFYLEASGWNIDTALAGFYETEHDPEPSGNVAMDAEDSETEADSTPQAADAMSALLQSLRQAPQQVGNIPNLTALLANSGQRKPRPGGPATLDSLRHHDSPGESSDDEERGQAFYAGGSESSGQQVLGPPKKRDELVAEMFKKAREHGAEEVFAGSSAGKAKPTKFGGTGYKLGESANDSVTIPGGGTGRAGQPHEVVLRLWSTGFTVNDGTLRDYNDVANLNFLSSVKRGEVPAELIRAANGQEVQLTMEDHRTEDYKPPAQASRPFAGRGQMLGSPVPTTVGSTQPGSENDRKANELAAQSQVNVATSEPTTNITFRLADGTRVNARFNHSHTVQDLYQFVNTARPQFASTNYVLTFFPNTELTKREETVKEANVLNAALIQKIK
ncbi:unnamed protein product [Allacma fusca]|uniref:NSFL1 cofactor p47 n=1 Tax=Allacma fusca TaxID=39272 RepID=A0A8J2MFK0_9HEXA|nr:unnamed protein product [Allacma fusca]